MAEVKLTKNMWIPFIDVSDGSGEPEWKRIDKSTIFDLQMNPEEESQDYISQEMPSTEIKNYAPSMDQEIATYKENPIYEFMQKKFYNCDLAHGKSLICFPPNGADEKLAWLISDTTYSLTSINPVDGKLTWNMKFGGNITRGSYTVEAGVPTFTPAAE